MKIFIGKQNFLFSFSIIILIALSFYFIIVSSLNVRYWADDFCSAATLDKLGFWESQRFWWESWSGRYSFTALLSFFQLFGLSVAKLIPIVTYLLLILSARMVFRKNTVLLSALIVTLIIINSPNIIQSFYWQTGVLTYTVPFIFFNFFMALVIWPQTKKALYFAPVLTFIAGGFSEAYALTQLLALVLTFLIIKVSNFKDNDLRLKIALLGFSGSLLSLLIVAVAPGNEARSLTVTQPESIMFIVKNTLLTTKWYLLRIFSINTFIYSLIVAISAVSLFTNKPKVTKKISLLVVFISLVSIMLFTMTVMFSGYYSMAYIPPERTLFIVFYMIFVCVLAITYFGSALLKHKPRNIIAIVGVVATLMLINTFATHWSNVQNELTAYAKEWDEQEEIIINAGLKGVVPVIKEVRPVGNLDGFVENDGWVSSCAAGYYKVDNIDISNE